MNVDGHSRCYINHGLENDATCFIPYIKLEGNVITMSHSQSSEKIRTFWSIWSDSSTPTFRGS